MNGQSHEWKWMEVPPQPKPFYLQPLLISRPPAHSGDRGEEWLFLWLTTPWWADWPKCILFPILRLLPSLREPHLPPFLAERAPPHAEGRQRRAGDPVAWSWPQPCARQPRRPSVSTSSGLHYPHLLLKQFDQIGSSQLGPHIKISWGPLKYSRAQMAPQTNDVGPFRGWDPGTHCF